ncbi:MAG: carboxymuconolactone decarboxylase family protein [Deltaproteobacteria bacterium]|nr:carboxymuconolactone decarboxylase family protein [Deltaproteobacteria bacterium]
MTRIAIPARDAVPTPSQPLLDGVEKQLGTVPNLFRLFALSPAALQGYLGLSGALAKTLDAKTRERIAIAIAQANGCDYCLSAHTYLGRELAKLTPEDAELARQGTSTDPKAAAAVHFARTVLATRGKVPEGELATVREAGFTDAQIVEIVAHVAVNFLTNILNNVAETEIDFPVVRVADAA